MSKAAAPELKKYMDKRLFLELNGNRKVSGVLRGFDPFMNIVLEDATEEVSATDRQDMGMIVIRGNSIVVLEALEKIV
ncbi:small nuclear ribonucleoprotein G-like protein [Chytriomyces cf. hyalinus JEL632]|nr:small nuclear ribonucleoprotein G-like protein [Chytriomyces cf. hyalinus JEL632]KAI8844322.1 small nuclear ribonucleoprotein G-like protein [Chytriomyces cf. hyalinus JEL632]